MAQHMASVTVNAPVHQVYQLFSHFNDFPKFMSYIKEVTITTMSAATGLPMSSGSRSGMQSTRTGYRIVRLVGVRRMALRTAAR